MCVPWWPTVVRGYAIFRIRWSARKEMLTLKALSSATGCRRHVVHERAAAEYDVGLRRAGSRLTEFEARLDVNVVCLSDIVRFAPFIGTFF